VSEYERIVAAYDANPKCHNYDFSVARARVAELEDHVEWHEGQSKLDVERIAELEAMGTSESARLSQLLVTERERVAELEAALAALTARRCWTCGNLDVEGDRCESFSDAFREYMKEKDGECSCTLWEAMT